MGLDSRNWLSEAKWLWEYPHSKLGSRGIEPEATLHILSLTCDRKNELSADEILLELIWVSPEGVASGAIEKGLRFKRTSEKQSVDLTVQLGPLANGQVLVVLVSEEDSPPLDPDDPIGAISFFPNQRFAVFEGDFTKPATPMSEPFKYLGESTLTLDAGRGGRYSLTVQFHRK